jgi:hypothetical protein
MIKDRPHRLDLIYVNQPLYFVTFTTRDRRAIPSLDDAQLALQRYARCRIATFNIALGRYVIMPITFSCLFVVIEISASLPGFAV